MLKYFKAAVNSHFYFFTAVLILGKTIEIKVYFSTPKSHSLHILFSTTHQNSLLKKTKRYFYHSVFFSE